MRTLIALLALLVLPAPSLACPADCDADGTVVISELVLAVQVALGAAGMERCAAADLDGDQQVGIDELVAAIEVALNGNCTPEDCGNGSAEGAEECDDGNRNDGDGCGATCTLEPGGDPCAGVAEVPGPAAVRLVTDAVVRPVHVAAPPLDPHVLFIVEQAGRIRMLRDGALLAEPFLDIDPRVSCCGERGLFSVAFHPDYERNGWFYVDYTDNAGDTVIARYTVSDDPARADPDSERILLTIAQPRPNHNGGQLAFGPDGRLYIGMGDGGGSDDPSENGQNDETLLGKLLRLDVEIDEPPYYRVPADNPRAEAGDPLGLIWAKGLRNPWRFSFDRATGDLFIADVGQDAREEINVRPAGSPGGENYGWDIFEGFACHEPDPALECPDQVAPFTPPVLDYPRADGCSITGGFVYRGCTLPDLRGQYFFSDYCAAFLRSFVLQDGVVADLQDRTDALQPGGRLLRTVSSFGEDARGELYIADLGGAVYRLDPSAPAAQR